MSIIIHLNTNMVIYNQNFLTDLFVTFHFDTLNFCFLILSLSLCHHTLVLFYFDFVPPFFEPIANKTMDLSMGLRSVRLQKKKMYTKDFRFRANLPDRIKFWQKKIVPDNAIEIIHHWQFLFNNVSKINANKRLKFPKKKEKKIDIISRKYDFFEYLLIEDFKNDDKNVMVYETKPM